MNNGTVAKGERQSYDTVAITGDTRPFRTGIWLSLILLDHRLIDSVLLLRVPVS